ncbi:MAG TPA: TIGR03435 family protein [Vicinamibacterales bacterium]|jgi:uncharacterized protein (TIGR03435 family)|nr:TIGR03435 family protein [Vicinamibacterales bacterium]
MATVGYAVAALGLLGGAAAAQQRSNSADVVSITRNTSNAQERFRALPGGRFEWTATSLFSLVWQAYQRFDFDEREITGAPAWMRDERYDLIVQLDGALPPPGADEFPLALLERFRAILEDRFRVRTHWEQRDGPIYLLTLARPGTTGPGLRPVQADCSLAVSKRMMDQTAGPNTASKPECTFVPTSTHGELQGNAVTIEMVARMLGGEDLHRPVVNRTGLAGRFDLDLHYQPEGFAGIGIRPPANDGPSIFTAVQEQLGLKLTASRGPIDVQVIDHAERPTEN